jgi:hypothetical protein
MGGIVKILREFSGSGPFEADNLIAGAVVAMVPQKVAGIGAVIPRGTNATAGNVNTSYLLTAQVKVQLDTGISATIGQKVFYNTATALFTTTKPAAGFFFGRALSASTAAGGYCDVQQVTTMGGLQYVDGLETPASVSIAVGTASAATTGTQDTITVAGCVSTDAANVWFNTQGATSGFVKASRVIVDGSVTVFLSSANGAGGVYGYDVKRATA